jgi:hypothetical protein
MIIISDGDASPPPPALVKDFQDAQVSVSTVAVFPHNGDVTILEEIAKATNGRFYYPNDPNQLPSIFIKEAKTLRRSQLQVRDFVPVLTNVDPMLKEISDSPQLHGYVLTTPRDDPRATVVLVAPPTESELKAGETETDPILAVWRYGLGVTAAFTSDLTERWGKDWVGWDQYQKLVNQMITRIGRARREQFLRVYTYVNGNEGVVVVEDFHPDETLLDVTVSVSGPNGFEKSEQVRQIAPRRYQTSMPLKGEGRYQVMLGATDGTRNETAYAGFIVSYSPEYLRFRANPIVLRDIAEKTGGSELETEQSYEDLAKTIYGNRKPKRSSRPIFDWFLMGLACLLPLDVAIRRVQMDLSWIRRLFRKEKRESTATIGALLQRTGEVRTSLNNQRDSETARPRPESTIRRPMPTRQAPSSSTPSAAGSSGTAGTSAPKPDAPPAGDDAGTTSRLLAMKKRREQGGDQK